MAGAQRGFPSPSPTPSPNARYSGRWRLRMSNGLPSLTVPRHTTKTTVKNQGRKPPTVQKAAGRMASNTPPRVRKNIYLKTRPAPLQGKTKAPPRVRQNTKSPAHPLFPGNFQLSPGHTPATPPLTQASFQRISPRPSPHTSGDRQQRLPAASRVTVKRPYERFLGDGGV